MPDLPDILIQIHYHFKTGGVSTVIKRYADAFHKCKDPDALCYVISSCRGIEVENYELMQLIDIEECGYQCIATKEQFITLRDTIFQKIDNQFVAMEGKKILVIAHNMTIAKNPALSSAIRLLASKWSSHEIRFFSVIHDFAEEGRADLMAQIINLESLGIDIRNDIYCIGAPVHCVVPNVGSFNLLSDSHFSVTLLQNPISFRKTAMVSCDRGELMNGLKKIAAESEINLDIEKRIFYYPVRLISRKNIFEAMVLSCIACDASLLVGPAGKGPVDEERFDVIQNFIKKNKLSILFNAGDAVTNVLGGAIDSVFQLLSACDMVVSSSIAEGFGYSLFEPWIYGKSVIARKPAGFIIPDEWEPSVFYSWFPVPREWVSLDELERLYKTQYFRCYKKELPWNIKDCVCKDNTVDFGALSEKMQMQIVETVLNDPIKLREWVSLLQTSSKYWPGIMNLENAAQNSRVQHMDLIRSQFSEDVFNKQFSECFSQLPSCIPNNTDFLSIVEKFQSPHYFRLLLNPELM